jgi:hypothetical protein
VVTFTVCSSRHILSKWTYTSAYLVSGLRKLRFLLILTLLNDAVSNAVFIQRVKLCEDIPKMKVDKS